jgi:RNA polymerase sigma-70 factor, ECF subfamily
MTQDLNLLDAARGGDERAFGDLVEPHRRELHAHCYRMVGSLHDAEDALQETLLRAWRGLARFEGRSSVRSWLYTIATNVCLNLIERRPSNRVLPVDYGPGAESAEDFGEPVVESVWVEPYPDEQLGYERRESVELAFIAALQHLPARQRAALILREVLGFSAKEVAASLETTPASVNSALQRARKTVDELRPRESQQATLRVVGDERVREVVEAYMDAMERGDVGAVVNLLAEDATWSMPPLPGWFRGHELIAGFLAAGPFTQRWRHRPARANGQPAVGSYMWDAERGTFRAEALDVLTLRDGRIGEITAFLDGALFPRFGLPVELPA